MVASKASRTVAVGAILVAALNAGACARRYASGLSVTAPPRVIDSSPLLNAATPSTAIAAPQRSATGTAKPAPVARPRPVPRDTTSDAVGTTGVGLEGSEPPPGVGTPVVTVTTTPGTQTPIAAEHPRSLTTVVMQTLRRPVAAVPIGAGFAASAVLSVALYRRRHRISG
jgi:hypothetical protein